MRANTEDVHLPVFRQHEAKLESFRMRFAYFSRSSISRIQYKKREIAGQITVNIGICQYFEILTLKDKVIRQCSLRIYGVRGLGCKRFITLCIIFKAKKVSKISVLAD